MNQQSIITQMNTYHSDFYELLKYSYKYKMRNAIKGWILHKTNMSLQVTFALIRGFEYILFAFLFFFVVNFSPFPLNTMLDSAA